MRSYQVLARKSGAVVERILVVGDSCLRQKSAKNLKAAFNRSGVAALASQQAQQNFSMQVLADLVDDADILQQRLGFVTGERDRLDRSSADAAGRHCLSLSASVRWCAGGHAERGKRGEFGVAGALLSVDDDAAFFE